MRHHHHLYQTENEISQQKRLFRARIYFALAFAILFFLVLLGRMTYLQWIGYNHYHSMAEGNRISVEPIPAVRGRIYDRNHILLADNQPVFVLKFSKDKIEDITETINRLHEILPDLPEQKLNKFEERLKVSSKYRPIYLPYTFRKMKPHALPVTATNSRASRWSQNSNAPILSAPLRYMHWAMSVKSISRNTTA